jgi:carbonic anhydrase
MLTAGGATFELLQLHFHSPSEHTIAGRHYPLEAHFVHRGADGGLAVMGLLFREGAADPQIAAIWRAMPAHAGGTAPVDIPLGSLWKPAGAFASYDGSLTTPPCTEGVRWYVAEADATVSRDQAAAFVAAAGENARPVQSLNGRIIRLP